MSVGAVELLIVGRSSMGGTDRLWKRGITGCTRGEEGEIIEAYGGKDGYTKTEEELVDSSLPAKKRNKYISKRRGKKGSYCCAKLKSSQFCRVSGTVGDIL